MGGSRYTCQAPAKHLLNQSGLRLGMSFPRIPWSGQSSEGNPTSAHSTRLAGAAYAFRVQVQRCRQCRSQQTSVPAWQYTSHNRCGLGKPLVLDLQEDDELTVKEARQAFAGAQNDLCGGNEGTEVGRAIEQVNISRHAPHMTHAV